MKTKPSKYHNQDPVYYKYREFVVGVFALLPIIILPVILAFVVIRSDWAKKKFSLHFTHKLNAQIIEGNDVYILSKEVGHVKDVSLNPRGYVDVHLRIDEEYRPLIKKDAQIRLKQKNMVMGDWQMEIILGDISQQMVEEGDTLAILPPLDMQKLSDEVISIADLVNGILDSIAHGDGVITHLLNNDSLINSRVNETSISIRSALKKLNNTLDSGNKLLVNSNRVVENVISPRVTELFDEVDTVLMSADSILFDISAILEASDSIPVELRETLENLNRDLAEGEVLIKALQKHWILRKEVEEVREEE